VLEAHVLVIIQNHHIGPRPTTDLEDQLMAESNQPIRMGQLQRRYLPVKQCHQQTPQSGFFAVKS
jgi:hypothetical protein